MVSGVNSFNWRKLFIFVNGLVASDPSLSSPSNRARIAFHYRQDAKMSVKKELVVRTTVYW